MKKILLSSLLIFGLSYLASSQCDFSFSLGNDTSICEGDTIILSALTPYSLYYEWQDGSSESSYAVTQAGMYSCEVMEYGANLIENGDFEWGDTLFTSDYSYGTGGTWGILSYAGTYAIDVNPLNTHTNFASCEDHSSGSGNMMIVNGSETENSIIWSQSINVQENTNYQFSTWLMSVVSANPAQLQFSINGINFGATFSPGITTCEWQQFAEVWNSGSNTSAVISIVNQNTQESGNDFAIDDVIFYELCSFTDSIIITSASPEINLGIDTTKCEEDNLLLNATVENGTYLWQDGSTEATFTASTSGLYWTKVTVNNCAASDSIMIENMDCSVTLQLPNVFTPNGDGRNDTFIPIASTGVVSLSMIIYNRWGQVVFKSSDLEINWKGKDVSEGTYYWTVDYIGIDGQRYRENGWVSILK